MYRQPVHEAMLWRTSPTAARSSAHSRSESLSWRSQSGSEHDREIHPIKGVLQPRPSNTNIRSSPSAFRTPSSGFRRPPSRYVTSSFRRPPSSYRAPSRSSDLRTPDIQRRFRSLNDIQPDRGQTSLCHITPNSHTDLINTLQIHKNNITDSNNFASHNAKECRKRNGAACWCHDTNNPFQLDLYTDLDWSMTVDYQFNEELCQYDTTSSYRSSSHINTPINIHQISTNDNPSQQSESCITTCPSLNRSKKSKISSQYKMRGGRSSKSSRRSRRQRNRK